MLDIHMRILEEGEYIVNTGSTVRAAAEHFGISKSSVHKDVTERLAEIDESLYEDVRRVLDKNLSERHLRGGLATKHKYLEMSERKVKNSKNFH